MVVRFSAHLRPPIVVGGQVLALVLLALDARREWSAYGLVVLFLLLGALAAIPATLVGSPRFRPAALFTQTIGTGVVALALHDTADKLALWTYALSALVAVASPASRPASGRTTVVGMGFALMLTIGVSAPALAWGGRQPEAVVCVRPGEPAHELVRESHRFDPNHVIAGFGTEGPQASCLDVLFDAGATAGDADDVVRRYSIDPRVMSVSRAR
jgi:branched-subunit amino acid transport protein